MPPTPVTNTPTPPPAPATAPARVRIQPPPAPVRMSPPPPPMRASSGSGLRSLAWFILGMLIAFGLSAAGVYALFNTSAGTSVLQTYLVKPPAWPNVDTSGANLSLQTPAGAVSTSTQNATILVPKAYANQQYYLALNALVTAMSQFGTSYAQLPPILEQINQKSLNRDFTGFFDLIYKAKSLIAQQKTLTAQMSLRLSDLSTANQTTIDAQTKSLTDAVITKGGALHDALQTYEDSLDQLLSGSVPSASQISDVTAQGTAVQNAANDFSAALKPLLDRFASVK